jgi:SpoVK/Ycf46/Vps4 family AAA+-type ATPase
MMRQYTTPLKTDSDLRIEDLARMTDGYSGSDIRDICQSVQLRVVGELFEAADADNKEVQPRSIDLDDFREVLKLRKPSVSPDMLRAYENWAENFKAL